MRWLIVTALLFVIAGWGCILHSRSFPIYTDPDAPSRISNELKSLPRETRSKEWYSRLQAVETPRKRLSDLGRGLCAAGVGLLAAFGLWQLYHCSPRVRSVGVILLVWCGLWLLRVPFTFWYYYLRLERFDYPVWSDAIAIPVFQDSVVWLAGAVVSLIVLSLFLIRHPLPATIQLVRPHSVFGWFRSVLLVCWLAVLAMCVVEGVADGDEGLVFTCSVATVLLLALLSATERARPDESANEAAQSATDGA